MQKSILFDKADNIYYSLQLQTTMLNSSLKWENHTPVVGEDLKWSADIVMTELLVKTHEKSVAQYYVSLS